MKNLITMYQKYRNHFLATLGILSFISLGILTVMMLFGHTLPQICIILLMLCAMLNTFDVVLESIDNIKYGDDEYINENEYQIIINVKDTENTNLHELIEKINKALNGESDDI